MELQKRLIAIQARIHAPKSEFNKFGGFAYRNAEAIYQALKPLLKEFECVLTLSDEIVYIGDRFYIKAIATISHKGESISASAYARESLDKKGMDSAQITGSCSSYARKYALGGLFLLDDNKDIDSLENTTHTQTNVDDSISFNPNLDDPVSFAMKTLKECGLDNIKIRAFMQSKGLSSNDIESLKKALSDVETFKQEALAFKDGEV